MRHKERDGTVLHDATSKLGQNYAGFQVHLEKTYSLGAVAVSDGTSQTMFSAFYARLERIMSATGARMANLRKDVLAALLKLKNSLSDRCPVEIKWVRLFQEKKFQLVTQEYSSMPLVERVRLAQTYAFFCMAHALSGMTAVLEVLFKASRQAEEEGATYKNTCYNAAREISKSFNPTSTWGFQLFQHYRDYCTDPEHEFPKHEFLECIGRFVGSRHHNQLLPCAKILNASKSLLDFLKFWERRKVNKEPNRMFSANQRALQCTTTEFEFTVSAYVYMLLVGPMLWVMGSEGTVKSQLDLVPLIGRLLPALEKATPSSVTRALDFGLVPDFCKEQKGCYLFKNVMVVSIVLKYMDVHANSNPVDRIADQASRAALLAMARDNYGSCKWLRLQLLLHGDGAQDEKAVVHFIVDAFPVMGTKLRDRQPDVCPGGEHALRLTGAGAASFRADTMSAKPTSDSLESNFAVLGWKLLNNTSMLSSTASIHLMARCNDVFPWLREMPEEERNLKIRMSGPLARKRDKEDRAAAAAMKNARRDKAKKEEALQTTGKDEKIAKAASGLWQTNRQMELALGTKYGKLRTDEAMKGILRKQLTALATAGYWTQPKGFTKNSSTVDEMKAFIRACTPMTEYLAASSSETVATSSSSTSSSSSLRAVPIKRPRGIGVKLPHDEELEDVVESDSEDEVSVMPCCGTKYDADGGYHVVQCTKCCEWVHCGQLGSCPGAGVSYNTARSRSFVFVCKICVIRVSHV